jgi:hypothetical protein
MMFFRALACVIAVVCFYDFFATDGAPDQVMTEIIAATLCELVATVKDRYRR